MRLLFVTQVLDEKDPVLGFVARWVEEIAMRYEKIEVICLREGEYTSPRNVRSHSLGKKEETGFRGKTSGVSKFLNRMRYTIRFKRLAWSLRKEYDAVFVHMNQEYILIAGPMWKLLGKNIYLWRNHYKGNWLTDLASSFCDKIFCTSKYSYTAKYRKTILMPVGVDTKLFTKDEDAVRIPNSILFLSRMSPSKRPEMLIDALSILKRKGLALTATFVGSPSIEDEEYYAGLSKRVLEYGLERDISFLPAVSKDRALDLFRSHEIFVNCSPSGMYDKTIFEAAACGANILTSSQDFKNLLGVEYYFETTEELADALSVSLAHTPEEKRSNLQVFSKLADKQNIGVLMDTVAQYIRT